MKLLIDADFTVYKCCAAAETEIDFGDDVIVVTSKFSEAYACVMREIKKIQRHFGAFDDIILFFSSPDNFRKKIQGDYKGHRNRSLVLINVSSTNSRLSLKSSPCLHLRQTMPWVSTLQNIQGILLSLLIRT